nr:MAG TPA: Tetraacyldisaccharide-1-P 4-kinase [Caudoviricetes sp.]
MKTCDICHTFLFFDHTNRGIKCTCKSKYILLI